MTQVVVIQSKRDYCRRDPHEYNYCPASAGVQALIEYIEIFNNGRTNILTVNLVVKYIKDMEAAVKLKGKKRSIYEFINQVCCKTDLLKYFEIHIKEY